MSKHFDVVALGEAMVEFNQGTPGEPMYRQGFGGDTSNAVIAAARQGARTAYLSRVGDDHFGRMLLDLWQAEGVDISAVARDPQAPTGLYFVNHGPDGHAFSYLRAGSAASRAVIPSAHSVRPFESSDPASSHQVRSKFMKLRNRRVSGFHAYWMNDA